MGRAATYLSSPEAIAPRGDGAAATSTEIAARRQVLVAFGDYDAMRLRQFAAKHDGALVDGWKLFGAASLFSEAAE
jgi:hypothetical protein